MFSIDAMLKNDREVIDNVALSINRKEMEYYCYIVQHRYNVKYMYYKYKDVLQSALALSNIDMDILEGAVNIHDMSKFTTDEFGGYRVAFYPIEEEKSAFGLDDPENVDKVLADAWEHHYKYNNHHPEHWVYENGYAEFMSRINIAEMILDWLAMQFTSGKPVFEWYDANKDRLNFNPLTRKAVEITLKAVKEYNHQIGEDNL